MLLPTKTPLVFFDDGTEKKFPEKQQQLGNATKRGNKKTGLLLYFLVGFICWNVIS